MKKDKWGDDLLESVSNTGGDKMGKAASRAISAVVTIMFLMFAFFAFNGAFLATVPAGHVGVLYDSFSGGVQAGEWTEGLHLKYPWQDVTMYSVRTRDYTMSIVRGEGVKTEDDSIEALTKEGLKVQLDMTVLYRIVPEKASEIHQTIGTDYATVLVRPTIRTAIRDISAQYGAKDIYSINRRKIADEIADRINLKFQEKGIILESVLLRNVMLPDMVATAIEEKLEAEQQAQRMVFVLEKETQEAERKKIEAGGIAEAQEIIDSTLTNKYLYRYWIENLDKHNDVIYVPVGENGMPLFKTIEDGNSS